MPPKPVGQVGHQRQLLVDDDDPQALGILDVQEAAFLALIDNFPLVGAIRINA